MIEVPSDWRERLASYGQQHLLDHWSELSEGQRIQLQRDIAQLDLGQISRLFESRADLAKTSDRAWRADPPPTANSMEGSTEVSAAEAIEAGKLAIAEGQVAVVLVAGGQGTRLGFSLPKGMLPVGPISQRTLFQVLIDKTLAYARLHGVSIPVSIMTSPATHEATVEYFLQNGRLGLPAGEPEIFCQGTMPAVDIESGRILLAEKHRIFLSPDGHGGMLQALAASSSLQRLKRRGIKYLFYGQIDNPLTQICDPATLGYHVLGRSAMTTQVIRKQDPLQRVGNVVRLDGRVQIIEYSDLPDSVAMQRDGDGRLRLWAGNIAVHVFDLEFLEQVQSAADPLPFHLATKKVPFIDSSGDRTIPDRPNALKFERFIFDLLPRADRSLVVEIDPAEGFAAIKNEMNVASENLRTAQAAMVAQHTRWLRACGATVTEGTMVEIHPGFALDVDQLRTRIQPGQVFDRPSYLTP